MHVQSFFFSSSSIWKICNLASSGKLESTQQEVCGNKGLLFLGCPDHVSVTDSFDGCFSPNQSQVSLSLLAESSSFCIRFSGC